MAWALWEWQIRREKKDVDPQSDIEYGDESYRDFDRGEAGWVGLGWAVRRNFQTNLISRSLKQKSNASAM